jgi:dTDP-4-amino-4,6-dideoxygalactose transaminase
MQTNIADSATGENEPGQPAAPNRIFLSPPHMSGRELAYVGQAFDENWIAPAGPHLNHFEQEFASLVGAGHAVAVSSGTAALHLALIEAGVGHGDDVLVSTFTFVASVNPIVYLGGRPVFVDAETASWNLDPELVESTLRKRAVRNQLPKAVVAVHLLGQSADIDPIAAACDKYGVTLIEDAAEALGATYRGRAPGTIGKIGIFSFNGNKIITTSGGGMLVTNDERTAVHARKLATQAREPVPHYEHVEVGYNYRLSNILAAIGRGQLEVLQDRVDARRRNFDFYREHLADVPGIGFQPEAPWGTHSRWLSTITIDEAVFGSGPEDVRLALEAGNIESRPVWKPMHQQPLFADAEVVGGQVADRLFATGLCLPSGSNLTGPDLHRIVSAIRACCQA